jgi:hypothetical protein
LSWKTLPEAEDFMHTEERNKVFNFVLKESPSPRENSDWSSKKVYVCSRGPSGGKSNYTKQAEDRAQNKPPKATGCQCRLTLTVYSDRVTGLYTDQHNHDLGAPNARFTPISPSTRLEIEGMLRMGIDPAKIVSK